MLTTEITTTIAFIDEIEAMIPDKANIKTATTLIYNHGVDRSVLQEIKNDFDRNVEILIRVNGLDF